MTATLRETWGVAVEPADFIAIVDTLHRFGAGQDLHDAELFASAFGADARLDFAGPAARLGVSLPAFVGRAEIVQNVMVSIRGLDTTHTVTDPRIVAYDGDRASLLAAVEVEHLPKGDPDRHLLLRNLCFAELSRREDRWVIDDLRIANVRMTGDPTVLFPREGRDDGNDRQHDHGEPGRPAAGRREISRR